MTNNVGSKVLVTGGAGYIGSHMLRLLGEHGAQVEVIDDLSTGHAWALGGVPWHRVDLADAGRVRAVLERFRPDCVMHFAARSCVPESAVDPLAYYRVNVVGTLNLVEAMLAAGARRLVFSSSCAVYGAPTLSAIDESQPTVPTSPYGRSKLQAEQIIADACAAKGLSAISLRYFNAAGAHPDGDLGEAHEPETHLIPKLLRASRDDAPPVRLYGSDHPTPDGTCIRDYVHVVDICRAHLLAMENLDNGPEGRFDAFNLGSDHGHSVLEVLRTAEAVLGQRIRCEMAGRRPGDAAMLVSSSQRARRELQWAPGFDRLEAIIRSAWIWERQRLSAPSSGIGAATKAR